MDTNKGRKEVGPCIFNLFILFWYLFSPLWDLINDDQSLLPRNACFFSINITVLLLVDIKEVGYANES